MIRQTLVIALLWMILGTVVHAAGHVVVGQGDTLARIAAATGTTVDALLAQNGLEPGAEPVVGTPALDMLSVLPPLAADIYRHFPLMLKSSSEFLQGVWFARGVGEVFASPGCLSRNSGI